MKKLRPLFLTIISISTLPVYSSQNHYIPKISHVAAGKIYYGYNPQYETMFLSGNISYMKTALENSVNRNCKDKLGNTALHLAAYRKDYDQIFSLINLGVDPNLENKHKLTCKDILRINQQNGVIDLHKLQDPTEKQKLQESHKTIIDILHESMLLNNSLKIDSPRVQSKRKK